MKSIIFLPLLLFSAVASAEKFALIVAGSNGFYNYRHQADVCHSFHILKKHGLREENIVVMMYDDIANNSQNPFPGKIFNKPHGEDVYAGVPKDYTGSDVTPENFLKILRGADMGGVGTGKTIKAGPNDHIFVYFADHGGTGIIAFPEDLLHVADLNKALKKMHARKQFAQLVFYMEACESGSMFKNVLPTNIDVYAMTASSYNESSWGCYCDNPMHLPCLGDLFSVSWMADSDVEDLNRETLHHQYLITKKLTNKSHVHEFGDISITKEKVGDFQGASRIVMKNTKKYVKPIRPSGLVNARDIPVYQLERLARTAPTAHQRRRAAKDLAKLRQGRRYIDKVVASLVRSLVPGATRRMVVMNGHPETITDMHCHKNVIFAFDQHCFKFGRNGHAMSHVHKLANLCEIGGLPTVDIVDAIVGECAALGDRPDLVQ